MGILIIYHRAVDKRSVAFCVARYEGYSLQLTWAKPKETFILRVRKCLKAKICLAIGLEGL